MRRSDRWQPGDTDPGLVRVEDICEVRVLPGTRNAQVLRQHGMGDAGAWGGRAGDLLVRVKLVGGSEEVLPDEAPTSAIRSEATGDRRIDISLVQAVLGGKVLIETPQGPIRLTIPAGTNSHTKMRLRGKGPIGPAGPTDLVIEFRIVVPKTLDPQSRELMEAFGKMES